MIKNKNKNLYFYISAVVCTVSFVVFLFFLLFGSNNSNRYEAKAEYYSVSQILIEVNKQREVSGLEPLVFNDYLLKSSNDKALDMAKKSYFSHISPTDGKKWSDFIKDSGYTYSEAGENLANGFFDVEGMVEAWMDSPSHKENILNKNVSETGIAISSGELEGVSTVFVVQVFGEPKNNFAEVKVSTKENFKISEDSLGEEFEKINR